MKRNRLFASFFGVLLMFLSVACTGTPTPAPINTPEATTERLLVLGDISDDPSEVIDGSQPMADYLASQLKDYGITGGEVRVARSMDEMTELLRNGEVDLYFDSVYPATLISDRSGSSIILRRWRYGMAEYQGVIFASADSGVKSLAELPGHMVAMDAPYSTSGFMLPSVLILGNGLTLSGKKDYSASVAPNEVGFVFSYDDENTLQWVLSGFVAAGVTDDYHFDVAFPPEATQKLVVLGRTESTPRQVVVARSGLDPRMLETLVKVMTTMHETEEGKTVLEPFQTTKFDVFPEGADAATRRMREMMNIVKDVPLP